MTPAEFDRVLAAGAPGARVGFLVAAMICGVAVILLDARRWPIRAGQRAALLAITYGGGLLGAFLPALVAGGLVGQRLRGGQGLPMSILGGLAVSFLAAAAYKKAIGMTWDTSDAFARGTCLMMAIGRLGCHASHCCLGVKMADPAWGVDFGDGCPRVPIQLVEAGLMFGLFGVFSVMEARDAWPHRRLFAFFAAYGCLRFVLETWREPMGGVWLSLGAYQWFALGLALMGAFQIVKRTRRLAAEVAA